MWVKSLGMAYLGPLWRIWQAISKVSAGYEFLSEAQPRKDPLPSSFRLLVVELISLQLQDWWQLASSKPSAEKQHESFQQEEPHPPMSPWTLIVISYHPYSTPWVRSATQMGRESHGGMNMPCHGATQDLPITVVSEIWFLLSRSL